MRFSEKWLRAYADPAMSSDDLAHALTMAGMEVEERAPAAPAFTKVVVAQVRSVTRHPDADKLNVCEVDVGAAVLAQIVCGAPNVAAGMKVPCALPGAELPGGMKIGEAKVRGVQSSGMLCSARELGLSDDHGGLLALAPDAPIGQSLRDVLSLDDLVWTLKLTPNLAHCMSVIGLAREVSAISAAPLHLPIIAPVTVSIEDRLPVSIEAPDLCGRFSGRIIRGVNAHAPTPGWIRERLERSGQRSISALVDLSNYVMLEFGRPTHVFDLAKIHGGLQVRWGRDGEHLKLLNGQTISLEPDADGLPVGVIADDSQVESLAGIMGGDATAVSLETTDIYVEAAFWWPESIAGRARRYNFSTDAAQRFERGVDAQTTVEHLDYLSQLILDVCGGKAGPVDDQITRLPERHPVGMRMSRARKLIGAPITLEDCTSAFERLGLACQVEPIDGSNDDFLLTVSPPSRRFDLRIEEDLIEEVVRIWGFERLPVRPARMAATLATVAGNRRTQIQLKRAIAERDWQEVVNFSFISSDTEALLQSGAQPIALRNPIAENLNVMRTTLWGGLLENLRHNLRRKASRVRLFEIGRVFLRDPSQKSGPLGVSGIDQPLRLAGLAFGPSVEEQWGVGQRSVDYFDVKADLEALARSSLNFIKASHPALHPGQTARIHDVDGRAIGYLGVLHPGLLGPLDLPAAPILFEIELGPMLQVPIPVHREISRLPPVIRDLAFLVPVEVELASMLERIEAARRAEPSLAVLQHVRLFDEYRGKGLENKEKSLAFRFWLQDTQRTLSDAEADAAMNAVSAELSKSLGARLRSS